CPRVTIYPRSPVQVDQNGRKREQENMSGGSEMALQRFQLRVEQVSEHAERLKLSWEGLGPEEDTWTPAPYQGSKGDLLQVAEFIRRELRLLAASPEPIAEDDYKARLKHLAHWGAVLNDKLFSPIEAADRGIALEAKETIEKAGRDTLHLADRPTTTLSILICDETALLPFGFAYLGDRAKLPDPLTVSVADLANFWLSSFHVITRVQGARRLPNARKPTSLAVSAVHEDLFVDARQRLEGTEAYKGCANWLGELIAEHGEP